MSVQSKKTIQTIIAIIGLAAAATLGHAQERDIQGTYTSKKGSCDSGSQTDVAIMTGRIVGPGFDCKLKDMVPGAGSGMAAYEAACVVDGKQITVTKESAATTGTMLLALDLGNNPDHFKLSIPGREDWIPHRQARRHLPARRMCQLLQFVWIRSRMNGISSKHRLSANTGFWSPCLAMTLGLF